MRPPCLVAVLLSSLWTVAAQAGNLPPGFVRLAAIDATIRQDIRYAGSDNFTGAAVPGYGAPDCILEETTARALARVQRHLSSRGYGLLVYDCYRPAKAVRSFVTWSGKADTSDPLHYPGIARNRLLAEGYIARTSAHSSGGTVDLTLVRLDTGKAMDMGTIFDFFGARAHTSSEEVSSRARANRQLLVAAMARAGFDNYRREWWHFHYRDEAFKGRVFDFDLTR